MAKRKQWRFVLSMSLSAVLSAVLLLSGCAEAGSGTGAAKDAPSDSPASESADAAGTGANADPATEQATTDQDTTGGKPWIASDFKQNLSADMELSPTDDFHLFVNHDWLMDAQIAPGNRSASAFTELEKETQTKAIALLEDKTQTSHEAKTVQAIYDAFLDWDARDAAGIEPVRAMADKIEAISDLDGLSSFLCDHYTTTGINTYAYVQNNPSFENSSKYIADVYVAGFLLKDPGEYANRTALGDAYYASNLGLAKAVLGRLDYTEDKVQAMFDAAIDLEGKICEHALTSADYMNDVTQLVNNHYTRDQLKELSPAYPLVDLIDKNGYGEAKDFCVYEPEVVKNLNGLYTEQNLEAFKDQLLVNYVIQIARFLDREAYDAAAEAERIASGTAPQTDDKIAAYTSIKALASEVIDKAYTERYGDEGLRRSVAELCEKVVDAYRTMLEQEDWLSDETRQKAIEKLDAMGVRSLWPDEWTDFSALDLDGLSYVECANAISRFTYQANAAKTNGTVDPNTWDNTGFSILEPNASYAVTDNSISIFLGIMGGVFYRDGMSTEELYGAIGCVIGHEISHAFDTNGAKYDKDGNVLDWWTEKDYAAFQKRADKLIAYYDGITLWKGQQAPGINFQSEAIADMAGVKAMLSIAKDVPNFDYEKFFVSYATVWRRINTWERMLFGVTQDPHPFNYLRTNVTLQQFDEFVDTYGIKEGDAMYLAPADRISVW